MTGSAQVPTGPGADGSGAPPQGPAAKSAPPAAEASDRLASDDAALWRSLGWFALARLAVAAVLVSYVPLLLGTGALEDALDTALFVPVSVVYLVAAVVFAVVSRPGRGSVRTLTLVQVATDVAALAMLMHAAGGVRSGLALLLILPNAGAAILVGPRLGLFFAAVSSLLILLDAGLSWLGGDVSESAFVQTGLLGAALLAITAILGQLARRLQAQQGLARRRGEDLRNQLAVTQAVIGESPDGVIVLGPRGEPRAINRSAREMLGGATLPGLLPLRAALGLRAVGGGEATQTATAVAEFLVPGQAQRPERRLRVRRLEGARVADAVLVLEDLGRVEARAQQLKLASMGRLSASIAHEIRNPLSAIRHANGLLAEQLAEPRLVRLATIVEDNCRRIDRVIEDVLSIARRGAATPQALPADPFLAQTVAEYVAQSGADPQRVVCRIAQRDPIWFDAGHLRQVLLNLLANALRHAGPGAGAVSVEWSSEASGRPALVVADDGPGVSPDARLHLFEPFFTTEARGTGLGLYLARELCTANGATIRYRAPGDNPQVLGGFVVEPALPPSR